MTRDELLLRDELTLTPARVARMLRMTVLVTIVVLVSMALRVPEAAVSAYMVFFVAKEDATSTVKLGLAFGVGLTLALTLSFVLFSIAVAEPGLRLPLMTALIFAGMYVLRTSRVGALGLAIGFISSYALTYVDQVPSPEVLVRGLLWLWVVIAYPVALIVLSDLAFGRRPETIWKEGVAARLHAAAAVLGAPADADARRALERFGRAGVVSLAPYVKAGPPSLAPLRAALLRQLELLGLLVRQLPPELTRDAGAQPALHRAADACASAAQALLSRRRAPLVELTIFDAERDHATYSPVTLAIVLPLIRCIQTVTLAVDELTRPGPIEPRAPRAAATANAAAPRVPEAVQFALKVTLAAMTAYLFYTGLSWFSIHTAMITCFFVAEDSLGATIHKLTLRLAGALVGAALGMGAIVFVLPRLESIGGLLILVAVVTLLASWIATGTERIAYAGWQIAIAFYLTVLQGYTRTSHLYVGRDRVIGILVGNIVMSVVFTSLWPVRVRPAMRQALARAVDALATMLRLEPGEPQQLDALESAFHGDFTTARQYAPLSRFEPGGDDRAWLMSAVEALLIPVHAIARDPLVAAAPAARQTLAPLTGAAASWLAALAASIAAERPIPAFPPPATTRARLERDIDDTAGSPELRTRLRLHVEWIELMRTQLAALVARAPA